jgi:hypothetical protein
MVPNGCRRYKIRTPDVDAALESDWAPRERGGGVFGRGERKDARGGFGKALERGKVVRMGEESKVKDAASANEECVWERSLVRECKQLSKKRGETSGESRDFENGGGRRSFENKRNRLTQVMPKVRAFGFAKSNELRGLRCGRSRDLSKFAGGAFANFGNAFYAYT